MRRSQAILRMPVNSVLATLILHDGERADVLLFIAAGEDITRVMSPGDPFVPMIKNAKFCLVARPAIAALGIVAGAEAPDDGGLPITRQRVRVRLRSGTALEIRESKTHQIPSAMQVGGKVGMQTMEAAVLQLVSRGVVTIDEVRTRMPDTAAVLERQAVAR